MESDESSSSRIPWTAVIGLLALAGGVVIYFTPLTSSRPSGQAGVGAEGFRDQDVPARLWQDPLDAVDVHSKYETSKDPEKADAYDDETHDVSRVRKRLEVHKNEDAILAVMIPGEAYAENVERRLRDRVAVVEGLNVGGYVPEDAEHIGSFAIPWTRDKPSAAQLSKLDRECPRNGEKNLTRLQIPYEWFSTEDPLAEKKEILVLWLRSDYFVDESPLTRLAEVVSFFSSNTGQTLTDVSILGPENSGMLRKMLQEAKSEDGLWPETRGLLQRTTMYSHRASASEDALTFGLGGHSSAAILEAAVNSQKNAGQGFRFRRTITPDDKVFETMVEELQRRDIEVGATADKGPDPLAVLVEWDTFYGRQILPQFLAATAPQIAKYESFHKRAAQLPLKKPFANIHPYSYLRGIDGKLPTLPREDASDARDANHPSPKKDAESENGKNPTAAMIEPPEGLNQSDYLRRVAIELSDLNRQIMRDKTPKKLGKTPKLEAVGVLGSDVYDKLEILHALRARLPSAIFFTNSLDARLFHPSEQRATRNLVVVSSYGLTLHPDYQQDIPPFRDAYQTACFAATLTATNIIPRDTDFTQFKPRIYVIGRTGAWDLSVDNSKQSALKNIHPPRIDLKNWLAPDSQKKWYYQARVKHGLWTLVAILGLGIWLGFNYRCIGEKKKASTLGDTSAILAKWILVLSLPISVAVIWLADSQAGAAGEPFAFFEGISIWPTEGCRIFAGFLCIFFLFFSRAQLLRNLACVDGAFFPVGELSRTPPIVANRRERIKRWLIEVVRDARYALGGWFTKAYTRKAARPYAPRLWREYLKRGTSVNRIIRIALLVVIYLVFSSVLMSLFASPTSPARDPVARQWDIWVLVWAVLLSNILIFYIVDMTLITCEFIKLFNTGVTHWPRQTRAKFRGWELNEGELADLLDIRLIALRTEAVAPLIYYPFVIVSLMILCRLPIFDKWDWPVGLIVILSLNCLIAVVCALLLRGTAEKARDNSLRRLTEALDGSKERRRSEKLRAAMEEVRTCDIGAFAAISRQPVIRALAFQGGGVAILALLQLFMK